MLGLGLLWVVVAQVVHILLLLFLALILAEGIRPIVEWLHGYGLPRPLAILLIYVLALGLVGVFLWILGDALIREFSSFVEDVPRYLAQAQGALGQIQQWLDGRPQAVQFVNQLGGQLGGFLQQVTTLLFQGPLLLLNVLAQVILILTLAFFWLTATEGFKSFLVELLPDDLQAEASDVLAEIGTRIGGYLRGVVINMLVIGFLSGLGLFLLGVPYPVLLGVLAGLTEAMPIVGPYIGGSVSVLVALTTGDVLKAVQVAVLYLIIQQVEGNTLVPLVMNRAVRLSPFTSLTALLIGTALFGIVGTIIAVPAAAALKVLLLRVLAPAIRRTTRGAQARNGA